MTQYSTEVEFKFFPQDVNQVLENLKSMAEIKQERTLLRAVCCRRENNAGFQDMDIIRVRDEGDKVRLTMKQRYQGEITLDHALEKECMVSDFDMLVDMFEHLGIKIGFRNEKYRTTWQLGVCEIVYDENPWLDPYFEIEGPDEENIKEICEKLSCDWDTRRNESARVLYTEKYGEHVRNQEIITFAHNPFII